MQAGGGGNLLSRDGGGGKNRVLQQSYEDNTRIPHTAPFLHNVPHYQSAFLFLDSLPCLYKLYIILTKMLWILFLQTVVLSLD